MKTIGFDSKKYLEMQSHKIDERIKKFGGKLYLEFGGKLFDDFHASRVLPGFAPDNKINMLHELRDKAEIVIVINSNDIATNKLRGDLGITYDVEVLRLIDIFRAKGLYVGSIVLSQFNEDNQAALIFQQKAEKAGVKVYHHYYIKGYPSNIPYIVSDNGLGKNEYIETTRELIVVTAPGPGSGKMATCLSQLYHDYKRGIKAGYAKYETFPIWNIPLNHPVNIAYEAATADLNDVNMIDPWHLTAYGEVTVNYNRDIEIFPVLNALFEKLMGKAPYKSPTDMGVNMAGYAISDDRICSEASQQEVIRRYYKAVVAERKGNSSVEVVEKIALLMEKLGINADDRDVALQCNILADKLNLPVASIQLQDDKIISGKASTLLNCSSAMMLNALKYLAKIDENTDLISPSAIEPIQRLKTTMLGSNNPQLHLDETLIALSISASENAQSQKALEQLRNLKSCEVHTSVILATVDEKVFRQLGINVTCNPKYSTKNEVVE